MTLAGRARAAAAVLEHAGFTNEESRRDAAVLARFILGWDTARWLTRQHEPEPPELEAALAPLVARRAVREPVAYIVGEREFYGRSFVVTRDVLIPRPETELLVAISLDLIRSGAADRPDRCHVVDVGTGSGCIAVTLALESPGCRVSATDISPAALRIAALNAARHGVHDRLVLFERSLAGHDAGPADLIVSNPPYIGDPDRAGLPADVRDHEPASALFAGVDGLDVIRRLISVAAEVLVPRGHLVMEIGAGQATAVEGLLHRAGLDWLGTKLDLAGIPRILVARRRPESV